MRPPCSLPDYGIGIEGGTDDNTLWPYVSPITDSINVTPGYWDNGDVGSTPYRGVQGSNLFKPGYANGLGVNSYVDYGGFPQVQQQMSDIFTVPRNVPAAPDAFGNVYDEALTTNAASPETDTQKYDIWRILSRGPVTNGVLSAYAPIVETQPTSNPSALGS